MKISIVDCRVATTLDVIRGKWKSIIITALMQGCRRYAHLRRILPEPSQKVLTAHLRELEKDRVISRRVCLHRGVRVEYSLTDYGWTLVPVLSLMNEWGQKHHSTIVGIQGEPDQAEVVSREKNF